MKQYYIIKVDEPNVKLQSVSDESVTLHCSNENYMVWSSYTMQEAEFTLSECRKVLKELDIATVRLGIIFA